MTWLTTVVICLVASQTMAAYNKISKNAVNANKVAVTSSAALTIEIEGEEVEKKIVIGLFGGMKPQTVENFRQICAGTATDEQGRSLTYQGSPFHRIVNGFMIHGGDAVTDNGKTNAHIYQGTWKDEGEFDILHEIGCVGLANAGADSSGSQFFIPTAPVEFLDGKHMVFGRVLRGMEVVEKIEKLGSNNGTPKSKVIIKSCEVLENYTDL